MYFEIVQAFKKWPGSCFLLQVAVSLFTHTCWHTSPLGFSFFPKWETNFLFGLPYISENLFLPLLKSLSYWEQDTVKLCQGRVTHCSSYILLSHLLWATVKHKIGFVFPATYIHNKKWSNLLSLKYIFWCSFPVYQPENEHFRTYVSTAMRGSAQFEQKSSLILSNNLTRLQYLPLSEMPTPCTSQVVSESGKVTDRVFDLCLGVLVHLYIINSHLLIPTANQHKDSTCPEQLLYLRET